MHEFNVSVSGDVDLHGSSIVHLMCWNHLSATNALRFFWQTYNYTKRNVMLPKKC